MLLCFFILTVKRIKQERDALLVENDRLAAQLEMMTAVKQQPR